VLEKLRYPALARHRSTRGISSRRVRVVELTEGDEQAWQRLADQAYEPSLNQPDFVIPASRHMASYADMALFVIEQAGMWIAAFPLLEIDSRGPRPHRLAATRTDPQLVGGGPPLLHRDCPEVAAQTLMRHLQRFARSEGWPGIVLFERLNGDGPATDVLRATWSKLHMPTMEVGHWERGVLQRNDAPEFWNAALSKERRHQIERRRKRLRAAIGAEPSLVDRAGDPEAIEDFLRLEASGWKGREGTALASRDDTAAFFREWAVRAASTGTLHVFCLGGSDKPVAIQCAVRLGDTLCLYRIAFDEEYARFGPGVLLTTALAEHFGRSMDLRVMDALSDPGNQHFLDLLPEARGYLNVMVGVGRTRDRLTVQALAIARNPRVQPGLNRSRSYMKQLRNAVPGHRGRRPTT
jgi:CelD/BcsL family acetyltransferase involved in cellulose biosynthesis